MAFGQKKENMTFQKGGGGGGVYYDLLASRNNKQAPKEP
jgi:hypothetical protein